VKATAEHAERAEFLCSAFSAHSAVAFTLRAILLIGAPIALIVRGLHEGLSWLTR
jgi:hypothetical protein